MEITIKIARRNINLRYSDDTTLMAESEEELKSLFMRVKEESEKSGLKLNIYCESGPGSGAESPSSWDMGHGRKGSHPSPIPHSMCRDVLGNLVLNHW